jgi:hypothetical protein
MRTHPTPASPRKTASAHRAHHATTLAWAPSWSCDCDNLDDLVASLEDSDELRLLAEFEPMLSEIGEHGE